MKTIPTVIPCLLVPLLVLAASPAPARAQPAPRADLSVEDRALLERGEYSTAEIAVGGLAGTFLGFGIGQAVEGRWKSRGWIFTVGELGSLGLIGYGSASCASDAIAGEPSCSMTPMVAGALAFTALRVWEVADAWVAPLGHNRRVRRARARAGGATWSGYALPQRGGAMAGLTVRF